MNLTDLPPRIAARTTVDGDCLRCSINIDRDGYSRVGGTGAHRYVWQLLVGEIPADRPVLDHVEARGCRWRNCINIAHLEPVTIRTNNLRGHSFSAVNARKDVCDSGHEFDLFNTYYYKGRRCCRACNLIAVAAYKARQRAAGQSSLAVAA